ncbi:MAG TPA: hypothetical protein VH062_02345 [Polyangiaceae bacterium]|jgi:hypothetical protein|nr:hypothetical protein [Polyangiaceae bacterium]
MAKAATKPRPSIRSIRLERLTEATLRVGANRLNDLIEMPVPPAKLAGKEELVRAIAGWMSEHGDPEQCADCTVCGGIMDMRLVDTGSIPAECVYCGVSSDDETGDPPADPEPEVKSSPRATVVTKPVVVETKAIVVTTPEPSRTKLEDMAIVTVADIAHLAPEQRSLVVEIAQFRERLQGAVQTVHEEMWRTGKWLKELEQTGRWAKHPDAYETWESFVTAVFGGLVTPKRAGELMAYAAANTEHAPQLAERRLSLPALPKPKAANEGMSTSEPGKPATVTQLPKNEIALSGVAPMASRLRFLTAAGKPASKLTEDIECVEELPCGVIQRFTLKRDRHGNLELKIRRTRG